jgi:hypothetical protein
MGHVSAFLATSYLLFSYIAFSLALHGPPGHVRTHTGLGKVGDLFQSARVANEKLSGKNSRSSASRRSLHVVSSLLLERMKGNEKLTDECCRIDLCQSGCGYPLLW